MIKRRDHLIELVYHNYRNIKNQLIPLLALSISLIGEENAFTPYLKVGFWFFVLFILVYSFLKWRNKYFQIYENLIKVSEGVFEKRNNTIPFNRVKSVNTSDTLLKRIFGIADLSVELIGGGKLVFVLKMGEINELKSKLFKESVFYHQENSKIKRIKPIEYLLISLTNTAVFTAAISIVTPAFFFAAGYIFDTDETNNKGIIEEFQEFGIDWIPMLISLAIIVGVIGVISYIFTFVYIFTSYGNFQVKSNPDDIRIEYGLLNRKVFQIPKEQIRSLRISEPFLSRVFGYRQLELDSISPRSKSVLLHPIIKGDQLEGFLQKNVPEIENQVLSYRPVKGSLFMFAVKSGVIPVAGAFILSLFHNYGLYLLLSLPIFLLYGFLKWKHSGLAFDDDFITVRKTKRFKRITVISMKKYTQATEVKQNFLMKRNQVSHYNFSLFSGKSSEDYRCDYLPEALKRPFLDYTVSAGKNDGGNRI